MQERQRRPSRSPSSPITVPLTQIDRTHEQSSSVGAASPTIQPTSTESIGPTEMPVERPVGHQRQPIPILPPGSPPPYPPDTPVGSQTHVRIQPIMPRRDSTASLPMQRHPDLEARIGARLGRGTPLQRDVRARLEGGPGADLSQVQVQTTADQEQQHGPGISGAQPLPRSERPGGTTSIRVQRLAHSPVLTLQREVFLGTPPTQLMPGDVAWRTGRTGSGARNVRRMVQDGTKRVYFQDQEEMLKYARGETETIGYVDRDHAWIRLNPHRLLVLGENHGETTLFDIVKAVGTKKFLHEGYRDIPTSLLESSKRVRKATVAKEQELHARSGIKEDRSGLRHALEPYLMKSVVGLLRAAKVLEPTVKAPAKKTKKSGSGASQGQAKTTYSVDNVVLEIVQQAMLIAAKSVKYGIGDPPELWRRHAETFRTTAMALKGGASLELTPLYQALRKPAGAEGALTYDDLLASFVTAATQKMAADEPDMPMDYADFAVESPNLQSDTDILLAPGLVSYKDRYIEAETRREYYMYRNIMEAAKTGYLLAGLGDMHRLHLESLLERDPRIDVWKLTAGSFLGGNKPMSFIEDQKAKYPQP